MNQSARPFSAALPASDSESVLALPDGTLPVAPALAADDAASDPACSILPQPLDSQQLLQGRRELQILHQGQIYRLQQTRQGKLILTK